MKKLNLLFTALLLLCCVGTAKAEEVTIDGIKYDVITKAKQATVINGGSYSGNIVIPSEITYNNVTCSVTRIGSYAFAWCDGLTSITIPNSVTSIGESAFLTCDGLTSITIPNSVTSIGGSAFEDCSSLTSITIPNSVTSIGTEAFEGCSGFKEVHINDIAAWCNIDFGNYSANPLYYAHNLYLNGGIVTNLVIPDGVTEIKDHAFIDCYSLTSIAIPNSVTSIGTEAFGACSGLTSITIPNSVTSIGTDAFEGCSGLTSITIPNSVTRIETGAFSFCSGLTSITIPNSVTSIGNNAFYGCTGLTSITIPNSVTSIGYDAFYNCDGLTSITIPNSVTWIESGAFSGCSGLTSITIPNSVTSIGSFAFGYCDNLGDVYCLATNVPETYDYWGANPFSGSYPEYMTLHVPAEAINSYKTTEPWSSFGNIVTLDGDIVETPKCDNPVIKYNNGEIEIECETTDAEFVTAVTNNYTGNYYSNNFALIAAYNISVYATATGHDNSDTVNATLCWIECDCNENNNNNIINIPAKSVFITSNNGTININCALEGEVVELYTSDAMYIGSTTIENGCATIQSGLSKGDIAIIKIAEKSIKVILN